MWKYHNQQMKKLKTIYQRISKQTQNKLQEIFSNIDFNFDALYSIANSKTKRKVDTYIEEWQDNGWLIGEFEIKARNIYKRTRVKNSEILELLIYAAYIEEQNKIKDNEKQIMFEDTNYYYQKGQEEVNQTLEKKKKVSVIPNAIFLVLLSTPNAKRIYLERIYRGNDKIQC